MIKFCYNFKLANNHVMIEICETHYSYTDKKKLTITKKNKKTRIKSEGENHNYCRIKVLDFFPLDIWIDQMSAFIR